MACEASSSKAILNLDLERRKELDRRKKLRILQVRQQSKDFAKTLREHVQAEEISQRHKYLEYRQKQIHQQQVDELKRLQKLYQTCLQDVGSSHREAAKQPDINLIKQTESAKGLALAAERGAEATRLQKENQVLQRQKIEAPIVKKQNTRNRENLRSFFVASLPKPAFGPRKQPIYIPQLLNKGSPCKRQKQVLQNIPSNLPDSQQLGLQNLCTDENALKEISSRINFEGDSHYHTEKKESNELCGTVQEKNSPAGSSLRECSCNYIVCGCHTSPRGLRRSHSESVVGSDHNTEEVRETKSKRVKSRSRSCSPRSVRTLNYCDVGNLYESNQQNFTRVIHHTSPPKSKEENSNSVPKYLCSEKKVSPEELKKKTEERSLKAVQREQLKKDFKQLLQDLANLSREKTNLRSKNKSKTGVYQKAREVIVKKESKQRKLAAAFETLIHTTAKPTLTKNTGSCQVPELPAEEELSVPSLNLALYQDVNMYQGSPSQSPSVMKLLCTCEELPFSQAPPSQSAGSHQSRSPNRSPRSICQPGNSSPGRSSQGRSPKSPCSQATQGYHGLSRKNQSSQTQVCQGVSDDFQINVKFKGHKKKCKKYQDINNNDQDVLDSSTSYFSPPENLSPSEKLLLDTLLIKINTKGLNRDLKKYIKKLLTMSRESIDDLNISSAYADPMKRSPEKELEEDYAMLGNLTRLYADQVDTLVDLFEECDDICKTSPDSDQFYSPPAPTLHGPSPEDRPQLDQFPYFSNSPLEPRHAPQFSPLECPDVQFFPPQSSGRRDPTPSRIPTPKTLPKNNPSQPPCEETPAGRPKASRHAKCQERQNNYFPRIPRKPTTLPMQRRPRPCPPSQSSRPQSREQPTRQTPSPCPQPSRSQSRSQSRERRTGQARCPQTSCSQSQERRTRQAQCPQTNRERPARQTPSPCPQKSRPQCRERLQTSRTPCPSPSPTPAMRQVQSRIPRTPQTPQMSSKNRPVQVQTPFGLSSNLLPNPKDVFGQEQDPCSPQGQLALISESPEKGSKSISLPSDCRWPGPDDSSFDPFAGLPVRPHSISDPCSSLSDDGVDYANFDTDAELKKRGMEGFFSHIKIAIDKREARKERETRRRNCENQPQTLGNDFGQQNPNFYDDFENQAPTFGGDFENQDPNFCDNFDNQTSPFGDEFANQQDWGAMGFGDEEFTNNTDTILQSEAPPDDYVEYPEDFPPPIDVFGPGFDWSAANQTEPSWPHSFPGQPLGGSSMSDNGYIALDCIDPCKDIKAVTYPPNASKLNQLRKKLSNICNNQYREVIKMLQEDLCKDQNKISGLLKRVDSSPLYDANETLAPIPHVPRKSQSPCKSVNKPGDYSFGSNSSPRYRDLLHDKTIDNLTSLSLLADHQEKYDLNQRHNR